MELDGIVPLFSCFFLGFEVFPMFSFFFLAHQLISPTHRINEGVRTDPVFPIGILNYRNDYPSNLWEFVVYVQPVFSQQEGMS